MKKVKDKLFKEIQKRGFMKTSSVIKWGLDNHTNTANRKARLLHTEGKIERMSKETAESLFGKSRESVWVMK